MMSRKSLHINIYTDLCTVPTFSKSVMCQYWPIILAKGFIVCVLQKILQYYLKAILPSPCMSYCEYDICILPCAWQEHQCCPSTPKPFFTQRETSSSESTTVQLGSVGSVLPQVLFAYWDQLQKKNETNCPEWYKFPSHAWGE